MTIGERIRQRREELGITQEELARRLGYKSRTAISNVEKNKEDLTSTRIRKFAEALEVSPGYLMGWATGAEAFRYEGDFEAFNWLVDRQFEDRYRKEQQAPQRLYEYNMKYFEYKLPEYLEDQRLREILLLSAGLEDHQKQIIIDVIKLLKQGGVPGKE